MSKAIAHFYAFNRRATLQRRESPKAGGKNRTLKRSQLHAQASTPSGDTAVSDREGKPCPNDKHAFACLRNNHFNYLFIITNSLILDSGFFKKPLIIRRKLT